MISCLEVSESRETPSATLVGVVELDDAKFGDSSVEEVKLLLLPTKSDNEATAKRCAIFSQYFTAICAPTYVY